ncbi:DUF7619 domain-containing protein [Hymenobacter cheonanensis]|uniref:DUF7619 domain-containing protein n=1 Tax=Hymenobacter sp. CA2-7 TaxID=3063993 RepID=UPI0027126FA5|nr:T9SS type A sorting domain-containing protein [Hymenobacter sp. CA2-7]MDO7884242.1 T9SS type A sorting domain-containing protein [Hymenobacter sp. CA2-7]
MADYDLARFQAFDSQGKLLFTYTLPYATATNYTHLADVEVDAVGNVYLLDENFVVTKLNALGKLLTSFSLMKNGVTWQTANPSVKAKSLIVQATGDLVVDLNLFDASGVYSRPLVVTTGLSDPVTRLTHDEAGNIYGAYASNDLRSSHLYKYAPTGKLLHKWGNLSALSDVSQDEAGNVYTLSETKHEVRKYDAAGQLLLSFGSYGTGPGQFSLPLVSLGLDGVGNIYVLESTNNNASTQKFKVQKFTPQGAFVARFEDLGLSPSAYNQQITGMAVDAGGDMYLATNSCGCVRKLNQQGLFVAAFGSFGTGAGQLFVPRAVAVDQGGNVYVADNDGRRVQKFAPGGQLLRQYGTPPPPNPSVAVGDIDLDVDAAGNIYVGSDIGGSVHSRAFAADGSPLTQIPELGSRVSINRHATRLLSMYKGNDLITYYVSSKQTPENYISGQVFEDGNGNCQQDATDRPLGGIVLRASPGDYYGMTDETGHYVIAADTGHYEVQQLLPTNEVGRTIQQTCAQHTLVTFGSYGSTATNADFGNQVSIAPLLRVNIASNRRRRCARSTTIVSYLNYGFATAPAATVFVALPPEVVFISADVPHTRDAAGHYVFAVGNLASNQHGSITIQDSVVCGNPALSGLTVCSQAWITPANSYPVSSAWNQASMRVQGTAQAGNQVRFVVRNTGRGAMSDSLTLRVYQNSALALRHRYRLGAGDSLVLRWPASRPVLRLEADQPAGHPTQRTASATVEVRGLSVAGMANPDMAAMQPNAPQPEVAEDCQPIVDSHDPNDKQVAPTGTSAQHWTPTAQPLRYRIRFQNTGSDDAYRVAVVDTLDAGLDMRTLRVEGASHPYRLAVGGKGRPVLTFEFATINLPPSTRNEPASNGFVQFSVQPKASLPPQTLIENHADIFFDYNPAVRTNTTANRIYDVPPVIEPAVALSYPVVLATTRPGQLPGLALWPNPAHAATMVHLPAVAGVTHATLVLRDALGRKVRTALVQLPAGGVVHELPLAGLPAGLYLLQVQAGTATAVRQLAVE